MIDPMDARNGRGGHRWWPPLIALGAIGCGEPLSLDTPPPPAASTSTGSTGSSTTGDVAADSTDGAPLPDLPSVPLPGSCQTACLTVSELWSVDIPPPPDVDEVRLTGAVLLSDGKMVLSESHDGEPWLRVLTHDGQPYTLFAATPPCACDIVASSDWGDAALVAVTGEVKGTPVLVPGIVYPDENAVSWHQPGSTYDGNAQVGSIFELRGSSYYGLTIVDRSVGTRLPDNDGLYLMFYESIIGYPESRRLIDSQPPMATTHLPQAKAANPLLTAVAFTDGSGSTPTGYLLWLMNLDIVTPPQRLPGPPDAMEITLDQTMVVAGLHREPTDPPGEHALFVANSHPDALRWTFETIVTAPVAGLPTLTVDDEEHTTVVVRTTGEAPEDAALWMWQLDPQGNLLWSTTRPLPPDPGPPPLYLHSVDDVLVLATTLEGQVHVERLKPSCTCE